MSKLITSILFVFALVAPNVNAQMKTPTKVNCVTMASAIVVQTQNRDNGETREEALGSIPEKVQDPIRAHIKELINFIFDHPDASGDELAAFYLKQCHKVDGQIKDVKDV